MKKFILPFILIAFFVMQGNAQNTFVRGDNVLNLTVGFGNSIYSGGGYSNTTPAIAVSYEKGVVDDVFDAYSSIGVGGYLGYTGSEFTYGPGFGWDYTSFIIGARGSLHYQIIDQLDSYTGLMLGYNIVSTNTFGIGTISTDPDASKILIGWHLGGRYYLTENVAGLLELGFGVAYVNIGVAIKF